MALWDRFSFGQLRDHSNKNHHVCRITSCRSWSLVRALFFSFAREVHAVLQWKRWFGHDDHCGQYLRIHHAQNERSISTEPSSHSAMETRRGTIPRALGLPEVLQWSDSDRNVVRSSSRAQKSNAIDDIQGTCKSTQTNGSREKLRGNGTLF